MEHIDMNQPVYLQVADRVKQYPLGASRADIAADFQVEKSTAAEHLEKCVKLGILKKFKGWTTKRSRGWIYIDPDDAPTTDLDDPALADDDRQPLDSFEQHVEDMRSHYAEENGETPPYAPDDEMLYEEDYGDPLSHPFIGYRP